VRAPPAPSHRPWVRTDSQDLLAVTVRLTERRSIEAVADRTELVARRALALETSRAVAALALRREAVAVTRPAIRVVAAIRRRAGAVATVTMKAHMVTREVDSAAAAAAARLAAAAAAAIQAAVPAVVMMRIRAAVAAARLLRSLFRTLQSSRIRRALPVAIVRDTVKSVSLLPRVLFSLFFQQGLRVRLAHQVLPVPLALPVPSAQLVLPVLVARQAVA